MCPAASAAASGREPSTPTLSSAAGHLDRVFDYNSSQLSPAGREVVRFAADNNKARPPSSVQVTGYTDPSGSAGYNQRLSLRRANAVAAELQSDGVPQSALVVSGQGESSNEPTPGQDRRVEVTVGAPPAAS
jgi:OmpA-OmpF porin, OOP family